MCCFSVLMFYLVCMFLLKKWKISQIQATAMHIMFQQFIPVALLQRPSCEEELQRFTVQTHRIDLTISYILHAPVFYMHLDCIALKKLNFMSHCIKTPCMNWHSLSRWSRVLYMTFQYTSCNCLTVSKSPSIFIYQNFIGIWRSLVITWSVGPHEKHSFLTDCPLMITFHDSFLSLKLLFDMICTDIIES